MASKRMKKAERVKATPETKETRAVKDDPKESQHDESAKMDFGGLPDRDLKKNLGCG